MVALAIATVFESSSTINITVVVPIHLRRPLPVLIHFKTALSICMDMPPVSRLWENDVLEYVARAKIIHIVSPVSAMMHTSHPHRL